MRTKFGNSQETVIMGKEPLWTDVSTCTEEQLSSRFMRSLNWYNYFCSPEDCRDFVLEYCKTTEGFSKDFLVQVKNINKNSPIFVNMGALCRILVLGGKLPRHDEKFFKDHLSELRSQASNASSVSEETKSNKPSVQQNIKEKIHNTISKIEEKIDMFVDAKDCKQFMKSFNIDSWIVNNKLKTYECAAIQEYYAGIIQEKEEALAGTDSQLNEAYSYMGKVKLRHLVGFLQEIIDISGHHALMKSERKPRKKKKKSAEQLTKKLIFQKEDTEFGLTSMDPRDIIGASKLVIFNTKSRKMCIFESQSSEGFSVRGNTLLNVNKSVCKVIRKPEDFMKSVSGGIRSITNQFDSLKTKESEPTPRINQFTMLLKAAR